MEVALGGVGRTAIPWPPIGVCIGAGGGGGGGGGGVLLCFLKNLKQRRAASFLKQQQLHIKTTTMSRIVPSVPVSAVGRWMSMKFHPVCSMISLPATSFGGAAELHIVDGALAM